MILESDRNHYIKRPPVVPRYTPQNCMFYSSNYWWQLKIFPDFSDKPKFDIIWYAIISDDSLTMGYTVLPPWLLVGASTLRWPNAVICTSWPCLMAQVGGSSAEDSIFDVRFPVIFELVWTSTTMIHCVYLWLLNWDFYFFGDLLAVVFVIVPSFHQKR